MHEIVYITASDVQYTIWIGWPYLSNGYLTNAASSALRVFRRVKDHQTLLHYSPPLKKTCVRQVVLDKWFPT